MKKIFNVLLTLFVTSALGFALLNVLSRPEGKGFFGYKGYIVLSDSMAPKFLAGDYIIDEVIPFETLAIGDVVTYLEDDDVIVTHRVIEIAENQLQVQGDGNDFADETKVTTKNYIGKQRYTIPKLGFWMMKLSQPLTILFLGLFGLIVVFYKVFRKK